MEEKDIIIYRFYHLSDRNMNKQKRIQDLKSQVISLRFFNTKKMSQKEVSKVLRVSISTVKRYEKKYKKDLT